MIPEPRKISFLNLRDQYLSIKTEVDHALNRVLKSGTFSGGSEVINFENSFAQVHRASHCIAVGNGTSALNVILQALSIGSDDEIILPTNSCFPTAEAVCLTGATPVFIDCEDQYYNLDPDQIEQAVTKKTKAVIAVHLYGQPAALTDIKRICQRHRLYLIEDCAQAHLASHDNIPVGNFGIAGSFSFYPTKNLGAYGEGGAVVTNDQSLAYRIRALKNHGSVKKNIHESVGHNYRMDSLQAAVLSVKLKHLSNWTSKRQQNAGLYHAYLSEVDRVIVPEQHPSAKHVFHQYVIRTSRRSELKKYLDQCGIETAIHYPTPCHLQPALRHLSYSKSGFPVSEKLAEEILSLPVAEHLGDKDINYISDCIRTFFR